MAYRILMLLLASSFAHGNIHIDVNVGSDQERFTVEYKGEDVAPIHSQEYSTFKINNDILKKAVEKDFGKKPDDVYLNEPTPWNLYETYGWEEVKKVLKPVRARVLNVSSEEVLINKQKFYNNRTIKAMFDGVFSKEVGAIALIIWNTNGNLIVNETISINFEIGNFRYNATWGKNVKINTNLKINPPTKFQFELRPKEIVFAEMRALRGILEVEVEFAAFLQGLVALNYGSKYKGHHFWGMPVEELQEISNLPAVATSKATIKLDYYVNPKVIFYN